MDTQTAQMAVESLARYIKDNGGIPSKWYCGITDDIGRRLFDEHRVPRNGIFDYKKCIDNNHARSAEKSLLDWGCIGGDGGGGASTVYVYIYKTV